MAFENAVGTDIAVDRVAAHRHDAHMADAVLVEYGHVGRTASDIDHGHTLLLLVFGGHSLGRSDGVEEKPCLPDFDLLQRALHTADGVVVAEHEVEHRLELVAERAHWVHRLLVVDDIILRNDLDDGLSVGSLHIAHALVKLLDVLLADLAVAADKNVIGIFDAADVLSRNARIGFPDRDLLAGLDRLGGSFDALGNQFDVLDLAADDALHGGDFAINDADFAALAARADYRRHRVGAQINCNYIISVFHFSALYLAYSFLHL